MFARLCRASLKLRRPELHPNGHLGIAVLNALNIKRGFWKLSPGQYHSNGVSPYTSTPESATYASSAAGHGQPSASGSGSANSASASVHPMDSDPPRGDPNGTGEGSDVLPVPLNHLFPYASDLKG